MDHERRELERLVLAGDEQALDRLKHAWLRDHGIISDADLDALRREAQGGCLVEHGLGCHYKVPRNYCRPCRAGWEVKQVELARAQLCPRCRT